MGKQIDDGKATILLPEIMQGNNNAVALIQEYRNDIVKNRPQTDQSKYQVMEGMQNKDKVPFFTEFINFDDILRMNTIEMFGTVSPYIIRKTSEDNMKKIIALNKVVYTGHVETHKINMVSLERKREESYTKILSSDSSDSGNVPTGFRKFFGMGAKK